MPSLLHELRDSRSLYAPLDIDTLRNELLTHRKMGDIDNLETQMYYLRRFKAAQILRVSAADITGKLPLMKVSDHLTNTASAILAEVQQIAWHHTIVRHGSPPHEMLEQVYENFSIVGYGKLGGIEMGYGSDLDLVFLFDDQLSFTTIGENPIQSAEFYYRLAQLIIHILSNTQTATGVLYTVDTRLRPSGNAGLLVNTLSSFREYQMSQAWTWEHQAIVRARPITGGRSIIQKFNDIRSEALSRERDRNELKNQIHEMQERMRQSIKPAPKGEFNLKQGLGGITDIEFIAQYGVLLWGHRSRHIFTFTDTIRILESFASAGFMEDDHCILLCDAYRAYRQELHRLVLQNKPEYIPEDKYLSYRENVIEFWNKL